MPRLKCPRCSTIVEAAEGAAPVCPQCGFGSTARAAPVAPPPSPVWASPPAPPSAVASAPAKRPGWVTFVAVYYFIGAAIGLLVGLVAILAGGTLAAYFEGGAGEFGDLLGGLIIVVGILALAFGALALVVAINVLKGRNWARITAMVLAIVGLVFSALSILAGDFTSLVSIALDVLVLVALTRPESKAFFGASPRAV